MSLVRDGGVGDKEGVSRSREGEEGERSESGSVRMRATLPHLGLDGGPHGRASTHGRPCVLYF